MDRSAREECYQDTLVAGQWQRKNGKFELIITENKTAPNIPVGGKLQPIS